MEPLQVTLLLTYVMCFSGALAILNSVPCVALDGQYMWVAVLDLFAVPEPLSGAPPLLVNYLAEPQIRFIFNRLKAILLSVVISADF